MKLRAMALILAALLSQGCASFAKNPSTTQAALILLAADKKAMVRAAISENPKTPVDETPR
jgi:hypothetical protein